MTCSFCGKHESDVKQLIAGPDVSICNECVILCVKILSDIAGEYSRDIESFKTLIHIGEIGG